MALHGRGSGGPKPMLWARSEKQKLSSFFARQAMRSSAVTWLHWMLSNDGDAPVQISALVGARVHGVANDAFGTLVRMGVGAQPGEGSCHKAWLVDGHEVPEGTPCAIGVVRGGTAEIEIKLDDGLSA